MIESDWFAYTQSSPQALLRLFCLPHAGGGAGVFREWVAALGPEIEVLPIQLPGRETRFLERPFDNFPQLLVALSEAIRPFLDKPYAFFGHSLGALIAFELARRFEQEGIEPTHLFVSGYGAPHLPPGLEPMHHLEASRFAEALRNLNTVPTAVLENNELFNLLLPMLRADFAVYEQYQYQAGEPLSCPITVLNGEADPLVQPQMLVPWQMHTNQPGKVHLFPGDHFYLQGQQTAVWQLIQRYCLVQQTSQQENGKNGGFQLR